MAVVSPRRCCVGASSSCPFSAPATSVINVCPGSGDSMVWSVSIKVGELAALGLSHNSGGLPEFSVQNTVVDDVAAGGGRWMGMGNDKWEMPRDCGTLSGALTDPTHALRALIDSQ
jgi:hypothetical protein